MSCCVIKKDTSSSIKELDALGKMFDEVILEKKEKYQLLTLRDKARKPNYDYVVWLELKIERGKEVEQRSIIPTFGVTRSDEDALKKVLEQLLDWIDLLKGFEKNQCKQLNLFASDDEVELEPMPEPPESGSDKGWSSYFKKSNQVSRRNIMKQYDFFDVFHPSYYLYTGIDYRKQLPSMEEMRELYKQAILKGKDNPGRYDDFWWDTPEYIMEHDGLSDIELKKRLNDIRLFLLPYRSYAYLSPDLSYTPHAVSEGVNYRYYIDGTKGLTTSSAHDYDTLDLPSYDGLFNAEFLEWVRETLDVPEKEVVSDEDILRENIKYLLESMLWYVREKYDLERRINTFKDWKQFKADLLSFCKKEGIKFSEGGGSGCSIDGFKASISEAKKGSIKILQSLNDRIELNRNVEGLEADSYYDDHVVVWHLTGDEIYKKAFELLNQKEVMNKTTLFDFMAA